MARHRVQRETKPGVGPRVEVVALEGARLVTVGPESAAWTAFELPADAAKLRDSFVRLRPPPGTSEEAVERVQRLFKQAGARVRVEMPNAPALLAHDADVDDGKPHESARATALQLVDESHSQHRDELRALAEEIMSAENM